MKSALQLGLSWWTTWQERSVNRRIFAAMVTVGSLTGLVKLVAAAKEIVYRPNGYHLQRDYIDPLLWVAGLKERNRSHWLVLWRRSEGAEFQQIADLEGRSKQLIHRRFKDALKGAWCVAIQQAFAKSRQRT